MLKKKFSKMNTHILIEFIHQRMAQLYVENYHFESLLITFSPSDEPPHYKISNEHWYLVGLPLNITIVSDSGVYRSTNDVFKVYAVAEFTGDITISFTDDTLISGDNVQLQFIRV